MTSLFQNMRTQFSAKACSSNVLKKRVKWARKFGSPYNSAEQWADDDSYDSTYLYYWLTYNPGDTEAMQLWYKNRVCIFLLL